MAPISLGRWMLAGVITVVAAIALVMGLSMIDAPWTARERHLDERRIQDLSLIADAVDRYWNQRHTLPEAIAEVAGEATTIITTSDPITREPYEYRRESAETFLLCAAFTLANPVGVPDYRAGKSEPRRWQHGIGRQCFTLHVRVLDNPPAG